MQLDQSPVWPAVSLCAQPWAAHWRLLFLHLLVRDPSCNTLHARACAPTAGRRCWVGNGQGQLEVLDLEARRFSGGIKGLAGAQTAVATSSCLAASVPSRPVSVCHCVQQGNPVQPYPPDTGNRADPTPTLPRRPAGSARALTVHPSGEVLASVCLDRYLRLHSCASRQLLAKVYCKTLPTGGARGACRGACHRCCLSWDTGVDTWRWLAWLQLA